MAKEESKFGPVEVREISTEYGETGVNVENRTDVSYELGAEVDGTWLAFASVAEGRAEVLLKASAERQAAADAAAEADDSSGA